MNVQLLKELLSALAGVYPFQTESDKLSFLAQIESLDAPESAAAESPVEEIPTTNGAQESTVSTVTDLPANPARDNPTSESTANETSADVVATPAAGTIVEISPGVFATVNP